MNLVHHPLSPYQITEEQAYQAVTSGFRWVSALAPAIVWPDPRWTPPVVA